MERSPGDEVQCIRSMEELMNADALPAVRPLPALQRSIRMQRRDAEALAQRLRDAGQPVDTSRLLILECLDALLSERVNDRDG